jgi:hypothetical protein
MPEQFGAVYMTSKPHRRKRFAACRLGSRPVPGGVMNPPVDQRDSLIGG